MTTRRKPQPDPFDFEPLLILDKRIDASEAETIRDRWEFGRLMLAAREGKKRLPNGYLAALIERTGKSQSELSYRVRFAQAYPTEVELSNVLESHSSWHELVESLYGQPKMTREEAEAFTDLIRTKWDQAQSMFFDVGHEMIGPPNKLAADLIDDVLAIRWNGHVVRAMGAVLSVDQVAEITGLTTEDIEGYLDGPVCDDLEAFELIASANAGSK